MNKCIECEGEKTKDFAECFDGSFICEKCLWKETEEIFGRENATRNMYESIKHAYGGHECLEVPVNAEELCHFIDVATDSMFRENFDYNHMEGCPDGGFLKLLESEIRELNLDITVREYLKRIIYNETDEFLDHYMWNFLVLSHAEVIQVGLEHKLPECIAI